MDDDNNNSNNNNNNNNKCCCCCYKTVAAHAEIPVVIHTEKISLYIK